MQLNQCCNNRRWPVLRGVTDEDDLSVLSQPFTAVRLQRRRTLRSGVRHDAADHSDISGMYELQRVQND